jgi:hypothetical protein
MSNVIIKGSILYNIECINLAGFSRKRLPELNEKIDYVKIKKFKVMEITREHIKLRNTDCKYRDSRIIGLSEFNNNSNDYCADEQSAIDMSKKLWNEDIFKLKQLIIKNTSNEEIHWSI